MALFQHRDLPMITFLFYNVICNMHFLLAESLSQFVDFLFYPHHASSGVKEGMGGSWELRPHASRLWGKSQKDSGSWEGLCTGSPWPGIRAPSRFIKAQQFASNLSTHWVSVFAERTLLPKKCLKSLHYIFQFIQIPQSFNTMLGKSRKETLLC